MYVLRTQLPLENPGLPLVCTSVVDFVVSSSQVLAMRTADENDCSIIIANDPDADRLAVAEKQKDSSWRVFNGNEVGSLLGWWALDNYKKKHPNFDGLC